MVLETLPWSGLLWLRRFSATLIFTSGHEISMFTRTNYRNFRLLVFFFPKGTYSKTMKIIYLRARYFQRLKLQGTYPLSSRLVLPFSPTGYTKTLKSFTKCMKGFSLVVLSPNPWASLFLVFSLTLNIICTRRIREVSVSQI